MEADVNKPLTNPKLSEMLNKRAQQDEIDENEKRALINAIVEECVTNARFLSIVQIDENDITKDENGNVTFNKDSHINFVLLNGPENKTYFPVFSDWEQLRKWEAYKDEDVNTMILSFDDYYAMVKDNESGIVINPFSDNIIFTNADIHRFKEIKDLNTTGHSERVITEDTKVYLADPEPYPKEMTEAIIKYAKTQPNINAIWLKLMINGDEQSLLLSVDFEGDRNTVFDGIANVARPCIPKGLFIDMVPSNEGIGARVVKNKPFYKKKKGIFGF